MSNASLSKLAAIGMFVGVFCVGASALAKADWLGPSTLAADPNGARIFVGCASGKQVLFFDVAGRRVTRALDVPLSPSGLAVSPDGKRLYVTCAGPESQVCVVDVTEGRIIRKLPGGHTAQGPVLGPAGDVLYVCNRFNDSVSVIDVAGKKPTRNIPVQREPVAAALTRNGKYLLVANHLHTGRADVERVAAVVSVIDTDACRVVKELALPDGSGTLNDIAVSPDGKYAVVSHILSRFRLPTTHLERGWMNTNAKTLIDLDRMEVLNTVLLDSIDRGAANPWGAAWSADGKWLAVTLAGTHEVSLTAFPSLLEKLLKLPATASASEAYTAAARAQSEVPSDLSFLNGIRERRALPAGDLGPRGIVIIGGVAFTANYFSDTLTALELEGSHPRTQTISLGPKPAMAGARLGELYFNDGRICYQGWQSCASCHPGGARSDGLTWDLLNDGLGNPKENKSLLLVFKTPPCMATGARETAEAAVEAGIRHILFTVQPPGVSQAIGTYIKSLSAVPSPHLLKGKLSKNARLGEKLFRSPEVGCAECHPSPLFTNLKSYDVGSRGRFDAASDLFDTPTLVELWRTAPYMHDGSCATVREVLTSANRNDQHGVTSQLTPAQIDQLVEYLLSL